MPEAYEFHYLVSNGDDPDDLRIRAGKYVHERVYLKIEKDLKTDDDLIAADVELSRRFTFEGQLGTNNSGLGLYWKRDLTSTILQHSFTTTSVTTCLHCVNLRVVHGVFGEY